MIRPSAVLLALGLPFGLGGIGAEIDRWLDNPSAVTADGLDALAAGDLDGASDLFDRARRMAPRRPETLFNAGTAHLLRNDARRAAPLLERASTLTDGELHLAALYNLGLAELAAGDPVAAAESFRRVLRRRPECQEAKINLELALRRSQTAHSGFGMPRATPEAARSGRGETSSTRGPDDPGSGEGGDAVDPGEGPARSPLAGFEDQPEMTAAEAAALLEAIDDLERQRRREERQPTDGEGDLDW